MGMNDVAPCDLDAEQAVLGAALISHKVIGPVLDEGLRPEHFYRDRHAAVFAAMVEVHDDGRDVDTLTVTDQLRARGQLDHVGGASAVDALAAAPPTVTNAREYARIVVTEAHWRRRLTGAYDLQAAVAARDEQAFERAHALVAARHDAKQRTSTPAQLAQELWDYLDEGDIDAFPWPFPRLNDLTLGGMRRGQVTVVIGATGHGKSTLIDQTLGGLADRGARVHLFINEMTKLERTMRIAAGLAQVDLEHIARKQLDVGEYSRLTLAMNEIPFGITDAAGWTAPEIAREITRRGYDVAAVDIVNQLPEAADRQELENASRIFNRLAKPAHGNCHVLLAAHLNRNRHGQGPVIPFPTLGDIKETGALAADADNVLAVWRDQDPDTGDPLSQATIRFPKVRFGRRGGLEANFDGKRVQFVAAPDPAALRSARAAA
jgi:replicative DNA helicase